MNSRYTFPFEGRFSFVLKAFSHREKQIFFSAMGVLVGTTIVLVMAINQAYSVKVPATGGTLTEGVLNTPAHINPLLASGEIGSEADRDISALVYSGLLRADGKNGFTPDLAQSYTVSPDGLLYTFIMKKGLTWHDGKKITAADVVFTIKTAQDSRMKSSRRASWEGVGVEQDGDFTVRFTLKKPYVPFLENATMGILPEHIWKTIDYNRFDTNNYNREPIGSGPYKIDSIETITKDGDAVPVSYTLKAFNSFALGKPHITTIKVLFFHNEEELLQALKSGKVGAINSISPQFAKELSVKGFNVLHTPLPRVLSVFFNQSEAPIFADSAVRKALTLATDKDSVIKNVLAGYGVKLDSPIPPGSASYETSAAEAPRGERLDSARKLLTKAGWSFASATNTWTKKVKKDTQTLSFDLATGDAEELKAVAQELKTSWEDLGAKVTVHVFATGDLKETIVRPRKFEALFFGQVLGRDGDPYPFWHSSQRLDPYLNIISYANARVDKTLEAARVETAHEKRAALYAVFRDEVIKDSPAVFMYAPEFLYIISKDIHGISLGSIAVPSERFLNVYEWYIDTDNVWKIFIH